MTTPFHAKHWADRFSAHRFARPSDGAAQRCRWRRKPSAMLDLPLLAVPDDGGIPQ